MAENFYTLLTDIGLAKVANAQITQEKIEFVEMAVGDGGGSYYNPSSAQTTLVGEVWRGPIGLVGIDETNNHWINIESAIPSNQGGFFIREVGLFDEDGDLVAVGKYPETYKPKIDEGSSKDLYIRMIIEVSNASSITLKVDPTIIIATRKFVDDKIALSVGPINQNLQELKDEVAAHKAEDATDAHNISNITGLHGALNEKMPIAGGEFGGIVKAHPNTSYTVAQLRNVILSPSEPNNTLGDDSDIWIKYV